MLSIENPPPDPPCPSQEQLNFTSDERASHNLTLQEVDLSKSAVDIPNFCIRDYVFAARNKDIDTNWPFSQRNLQLCLKHGLKDLLPPFQSLDSVRNGSFNTCPAVLDKRNISTSDGEPSHHCDDAQWKEKIARGGHTDLNSSRSGGDTDFPSTTTSNSISEIDSVPTKRISSSPVQTSTSKASVQVEAVGGSLASPPEISNTKKQPLTKKCRLIVKLSTVPDHSSAEDIASNCTTLSEVMTSKTCPVCKTFSSSSNTTLNAHIDQCLSVESTFNWISHSSTTTKSRIKPRKMRSMVDICATAPSCTLEELDRRNGSTWATDLSLPSEATAVCDQGKNQRVSRVCPEDTGDEGAVYIDANGTKVRILSKFSNAQPVFKVDEDSGPGKSFKAGERSNFFSTNKKKHRKYLKLTPHGKQLSSPKATTSEGGQDGCYGVENSCDKEERQVQHFRPQGQIKLSDLGTLRPWVCSKRTGLSKKLTKDGQRRSECQEHATQELQVECGQSCFSDTYVDGNRVQESSNLSESQIFSPGSHRRMGSSIYEAQVSDNRKRPPGRKRVRSLLFDKEKNDDLEMSYEPSNQNSSPLSIDHTSVHDSFMVKSPRYTTNCASLLRNKTAEIQPGSVKNSDVTPHVSTNPSRGFNAFSSKARRLPTLRKNVLSVSRFSVPESKFSATRKRSMLKKSQLHKEVAASPSAMDDLMHNCSENQSETEKFFHKVSPGRSSVQEITQERRATRSSRWEEAMALKNSQVAARVRCHNGMKNIDSPVRVFNGFSGKYDGVEYARKEFQSQGKEIAFKQSSYIDGGGTVMSLSRSIDAEFRMDNSSDSESDDSLQSEEYKVLGDDSQENSDDSPEVPTEPSWGDGQEMFSADEVGNGTVRQHTHIGEDMDYIVRQGNSFPDIDPIPIPGPPGSFLPSPGDTSSEDLQGNSSLTTSRDHSSQDQRDFIDGASSDSPISATSTIFNFNAARSYLKCSEELSVEPVMENAATVPQAANMGADRIILKGESFKVDAISPEMEPQSLNDNQPCCCSRKERISQVVALNYQESQLLKRRTVAAGTLPAMVKHMSCNRNTRPDDLNEGPEMLSLSNCPILESEKMAHFMKPPSGPFDMKASSDVAVKYTNRGDSDSPSASNPILRLMGKNLMVINKDENSSMHFKEGQPGVPNNCSKVHFLNLSVVSPGNSMDPQGFVKFGQDSHNTAAGQCYDVGSQISSMTPETPTQAQAGMLAGKRMYSGLPASLDLEYKAEYNMLTRHSRPSSIEKVQLRNGESAASSMEDTIVIDDSREGLRSQVSSSAACDYYRSRHDNPHPHYQIQDPSRMMYNGNFHPPYPRQANTMPFKWSCTSDGSGTLQRGPFMASSSSTSHLRSALYYPPSLS